MVNMIPRITIRDHEDACALQAILTFTLKNMRTDIARRMTRESFLPASPMQEAYGSETAYRVEKAIELEGLLEEVSAIHNALKAPQNLRQSQNTFPKQPRTNSDRIDTEDPQDQLKAPIFRQDAVSDDGFSPHEI